MKDTGIIAFFAYGLIGIIGDQHIACQHKEALFRQVSQKCCLPVDGTDGRQQGKCKISNQRVKDLVPLKIRFIDRKLKCQNDQHEK